MAKKPYRGDKGDQCLKDSLANHSPSLFNIQNNFLCPIDFLPCDQQTDNSHAGCYHNYELFHSS